MAASKNQGGVGLRCRTGSVLLCILLHASFTPAQDNLILLPSNSIQPGSRINSVDLVIFGTYAVAVLALVVLTRGRLGLATNADTSPHPRNLLHHRKIEGDDMTIRVAINGMGRMGRAYLRYALDHEDLEIAAVNDITDVTTMARLLRHDSTFGPLRHEVEIDESSLIVDGRKIAVTAFKDPAELAWGEHGVEVVIESTGRFRTRESVATHLTAGASRVLISAPGKDVDATIVMGVNEHTYRPDEHRVISNASCTTNCVAPMVKVLHEAFGFERGFMTTVHAYTNDQNILDAPHKDPRRARAAAVNIIPTTTGAARAVGLVIPELAGRLDGVALRVPVVNGSLVDLTVLLGTDVTAQDVNDAFASAARSGPLAGLLRYTDEPIVSTDVIGDDASCVFDAGLTQASGRSAKVFGWYDNEWGYTCRLADLTRLVSTSS